MSRLIVKNLPLKISEDKLRNTFGSKGEITDLRLKYTKDGKFRGFAFVGYKSEEAAEAARKYFHGTYIGAAKIEVHSCAELRDNVNKGKLKKESSTTPLESSECKKKQEKRKKTKAESILDQYKDDHKFQEFLRVHKRNSQEAWTNDSIIELASLYKNEDVAKENSEEKVSRNIGVEETKKKVNLWGTNAKEFYNVKLFNLPYKFKKKQVKAFLAPLKPPSVRIPPKIHGIAYVGFSTEKEQTQALNKHKSVYEGHQIFVTKFDKKITKERVDGGSNQPINTKWKEQEDNLIGSDTVGESGRIFVRNLAYSTTEDDLQILFSKYGPLTEVNLPIDKITRRIKGFAFITFMMPEHATTAFSELDGTTFQGRLLHLLPGKNKEDGNETMESDCLGYKRKKELKEKATSGSSHNWNSLFLGASAVADVMSKNYDVDKYDVVLSDAGDQSAAVRLALGETQIIAETKRFLQEEGISLDAFNKPPAARSKTVMLVKNLPAHTPYDEIREIFTKYGVLGRLVLPPSGVTAVVEFANPGEARSAFTNLAYTRFHSTPLYLEWAPLDTFVSPYSDISSKPEIENKKEEKDVIESNEPEADSTLFVKNLNFSTSDDHLRQHFEPVGKLFSSNVATKKDPKTGETLSMGFGFVTFWHKSSADKALKTLQHSRLDTHSLELKRSNRALVKDKPSGKGERFNKGMPSTKLLVRNIPFQANKQEVTDIFKTFGELTGVRLPSKMSGTGSHRGFAFIDFVTKSDAVKAMEALSGSTHLYGRRLVLEWASQDESLEEMRKRTAAQYFAGELSAGKRKKLEIPNAVDE